MSAEKVALPDIGPHGEPRIAPVAGVQGKFNGVMAWRPELMAAFFEFYEKLWTEGVLPMRVKDLARMKIARTVGCRICQNTRFKIAEGHTVEDDYLDIDHVEESSYTAAEKAALTYVEAFCLHPEHVTDAMVEDLKRHFSAPEIVELSVLTGTISGFASINAALNIAPDDEALQVFDFAGPDGPVA
jgi:alkylhydroperoxidase family enzyme